MYQVISILAILLYFLPIVIVIAKKLWHQKAFLYFALFWILGGIVNVLNLLPFAKGIMQAVAMIYNAIDIPVILLIFYFITTVNGVRQFVRLVFPLMIFLEVLGFIIYGFTYDAQKYPLGIGLLVVLTIIIWEIVSYIKKISHTSQENGLLFINAALLFEYGSFIVIYIFDYFVTSTKSNVEDNFIVYYISSIIGLAVACAGYFVGSKKVKQPKEVQS